MNIEHLKLFVRLASTHNISMAGEELGLSPAVASAHINKLEAAIGVRLVHRSTRKVSLTEEGQTFLPHAENILQSIALAQDSIHSDKVSPKGVLRITAPASFGRIHIMPALPQFMARYPDLSIDFRFSDSIIDLIEGGFDVAIRIAELKDSSLIAKKLTHDQRIICASPNYLKQYGTPTSPEDLLNHQCINLAGLDVWTFKTPEDNLSIKTKGQFKTNNGDAMRDATIAGLGLSINSIWSVYEQLQSGEIVEVLSEYPLASNASIWVVYPSANQLAPKVRAFIDFFSEYFAHPTQWDDYIANASIKRLPKKSNANKK